MNELSFCELFLRSINLQLDLQDASRASHFRPTRKSVQILRAILGLTSDRAFISTAAYGSGKSLAALFSSLCVENRPESRAILTQIGERMTDVDPQTADFVIQRSRSQAQGLVLVLEGDQENIPGALRQAARDAFSRIGRPLPGRGFGNLRSLKRILACLADRCRSHDLDRIVIVWDEFGRHLERLIASGRAGELSHLQQLAEIVSRLEIPATLTLLLHQNFFQYAGSLNQSARSEWKKIEGRFQSIQYVDDSREMIQLIAEFTSALRGEDLFVPSDTFQTQTLAGHHRKAGFLDTFDDDASLAATLGRAYPVDPAVLFTLPRLAGRIAQNERTVFDFIRGMDLTAPVHLGCLYDYFAPLMRADTGFGGTYKAWIETESALTRAQSETEERILKAACLLGIGLSAQRAAVSPESLAVAVAGWRLDTIDVVRAAIDALIERKLLLYRRHANEVSVWHGADVDLRGRLEEEKQRAAAEFDFERFLEQEYPPPVWKPVGYNARYAIRRYFSGRYVNAETLIREDFDHPVWQIPANHDGVVIYALVRSQQDIRTLTAKAGKMPEFPGRILAVPRTALNVFEAALELFCLLRMQKDTQLTGIDPLVLPELEQMVGDARRHLDLLMRRFCQPGPQGPTWYDSGQTLEADHVVHFREILSAITEKRFPKTPVINSEAVVRQRLSRQMVNARKKILTGILERTGQQDLGISGTTPDASMYRAVFQYTGLYRQNFAGLWRWAAPSEITDANLREVWQILHRFFTEPGEDKSFETVITHLSNPPYGVRHGVIPLLVGAAYKAFPSLQALYRGSDYLPDILPSTIEDVCANPRNYRLEVLPIETDIRCYLEELIRLFSDTEALPHESDLIRAVYDAICQWRNNLPEIAWTSSKITGPVKQFRIAVRRFQDPVQLLFEELPQIAGLEAGHADLVDRIAQWKATLEQAGRVYEDEAIAMVRRLLAARGVDPSIGSLTRMGTAWGSRIPDEVLGQLQREYKACLQRLRHPPAEDRDLVRSLAILLVGAVPDDWRDATIHDFTQKLEETLTKIEDQVIELGGEAAADLLESRLKHIYGHLMTALGPQQARAAIQRLLEDEDNYHGNFRRSVG